MARQTTLDALAQDNGAETNPTSRTLQLDAAIEDLDALEVKDAWVRGQLMHRIIEVKGSAFLRSQECEKLETWLKEFNNAGLIEVAIHAFGRSHTLGLGWEEGPGNVETLFERFTKDSMTDQELVEAARQNLKSACRGCGMPRISVMRHRVRTHADS
jgi:hypothetical protein